MTSSSSSFVHKLVVDNLGCSSEVYSARLASKTMWLDNVHPTTTTHAFSASSGAGGEGVSSTAAATATTTTTTTTTTTISSNLQQEQHRKKRRHNKLLTCDQKRRLNLYAAPKNAKFSQFTPLHDMWTRYMAELFNLPSQQPVHPSNMLPKLVKADFHGCYVTVIKSKIPSLIGTSGIILKETEHTLQIITPSDCLKTIRKQDTNFTFTLEPVLSSSLVFTLFGSQLVSRPAERVNSKRIKDCANIDLR